MKSAARRLFPALALLALCGCSGDFRAPISPANAFNNDTGTLQKVWNVQGGQGLSALPGAASASPK